MALYWQEAHLMVEVEDAELRHAPQDYPPDTLVLTMRHDQTDDPEFISAIRNLVLVRSLKYDRALLDELVDCYLDRLEPGEAPYGEAGDGAGSPCGSVASREEECSLENPADGPEPSGKPLPSDGPRHLSADAALAAEVRFRKNFMGEGPEAPEDHDDEDPYDNEDDEELFEHYAWREYVSSLLDEVSQMARNANRPVSLNIEHLDQLVMS